MRRTTSTRRDSKFENNITEQNLSKTRRGSLVRETRNKTYEKNVADPTCEAGRIDKVLKSKHNYVPTTPKCKTKGKIIKVIKQEKEDGGCATASTKGLLASPNVDAFGDCSTTNEAGQETSPSLTQAVKQMKEILRDDNFFSSQSVGEVVCDVQWECTSPDVCRQLLKKNNRNKKTVSEIALGLKLPDDEIHGSVAETTSEPFLGLWIQDQNDEKTVLRPRRILRKRSALGKKEKTAQLLPAKYQILLEKLNAEQSLEKKLKEENTSKERDSSDDLYDHLFSDEDQLLTAGVVRCNGNSPPKTANDTWSDDDLFNEDSFIVAATQMPLEALSEMCNSSKRKRESIGLSGKCSKDTKINVVTEDLNNNKGCVSGLNVESRKGNSASLQVKCQDFKKNDSIKNKKQEILNSIKPINSKIPICANNNLICSTDESTVLLQKNFYGKSKSNFRKHNSFSGSPTFRATEKKYIDNTAETSKSPFRKHHSFDACQQHLTSTPTRKSASKKMLGEAINLHPDTFSKTDLCKSYASNHYKQSLNRNTNHSKHSLLPLIKEELCTNTIKDSKDIVQSKKEESFLDSSISDEILKQLVEPDEILDSQLASDTIILTSVSTKKSAEKSMALLFEDDFSFSEVLSESTKKFDATRSQVSSQVILTKSIHDMNMNINELKKTEENESSCHQRKYSFKNVTKPVVVDSSVVSSKNTPIISDFGNAADKSDIDLILGTQELFNDNSFLNEDSLLESQFLAELDKVESTL